MDTPDAEVLTAIGPELLAGETILWSGRPSTKVIFHSEDLLLIPFTLIWGGGVTAMAYKIFRDGRLSGSVPDLMLIVFVIVGQYIIWGRFFFAHWKKKRIFYAITNRRVVVVADTTRRKVVSSFIDTLQTLSKDASSENRGTVRFGASEPIWFRGMAIMDSMRVEDVPVFRDIEDVDSVYRLVYELREKARSTASFTG